MPRYPRVAIGSLRSAFVFTFIIMLFALPILAANTPVDVQKKSAVQKQMSLIPLAFAPNQGQAGSDVRYVAHGPGYAVLVQQDGTTLRFGPKEALRLRFLGGDAKAAISAAEPQRTRFNYYLGTDRSKWQTGVPTFGKVNYSSVYKGVDAVFYGSNGRLEHDFVVAPGADPSSIRFAVEGAKKLRIDANGDLVMATSDRDVKLLKPVVYQEIQGKRQLVAGGYKLANKNKITFSLGAYDRTQPLVIDPVLIYGTYLGDSAAAVSVDAVTLDSSHNVYVAGVTTATNLTGFAAGTPVTANAGGGDVFIARFDDSQMASAYAWVTFLGGANAEIVQHIKYSAGQLYAAGSTFADGSNNFDFPTSATTYLNAAALSGATGTVAGYGTQIDSATGAMGFSTLIGGTAGSTVAYTAAADGSNNLYIAGRISDASAVANVSDGTNSWDNSLTGANAGFVTRIDMTTGAYVAGTLIDGTVATDTAVIKDIAVTGPGTLIAAVEGKGTFIGQDGSCGVTFPAIAFADAWMYQIDLSLNGCAQLVANTNLGASAATTVNAIMSDAFGAYMAGATTGDLGLETLSGTQDGWVAKFATSGWRHLVGGNGNNDEVKALDLDSSGNVYVGGVTDSTNLADVNGGGGSFSSGNEGFVTIFNNGGTVQFQRYIDGSGNDSVNAVAVDKSLSLPAYVMWIAGTTSSNGFVKTGSGIEPVKGGGATSGFMAKVAASTNAATFAVSTAIGAVAPTTIGYDAGTGLFYPTGASVITIPVHIQASAGQTINYTTLDLQNSATSGPAGILFNVQSSDTRCKQNPDAGTTGQGGLTCQLGAVDGTTGADINLTLAPSGWIQCDESHNPGAAGGTGSCTSYLASANMQINGAEVGASINLNQDFTFKPVSTLAVTLPTPPTAAVLGNQITYKIAIDNTAAPSHDVGSIALDFTGTDSHFVLDGVAVDGVNSVGTYGAVNCGSLATCSVVSLSAASKLVLDVTGHFDPTWALTGGTQASVPLQVAVSSSSIINAAAALSTTANTNVSVSRVVALSASVTQTPATGGNVQLGGANTIQYDVSVGNALANTGKLADNVTNASTATGVTVSLNTPAGFVIDTNALAPWSCSGSNPTVCTLTGTIAANATSTFTLKGSFADDATLSMPGGTLAVAVVATPAGTDVVNDTGSPFASTAVTANLKRNVHVTISAGAPTATVKLGATVNLVYTVTNAGPNAAASGIAFDVQLPAYYTMGTLSAGCVDAGSNKVTCTTAASLATSGGGASVNFTIPVSVNDDETLSANPGSDAVNGVLVAFGDNIEDPAIVTFGALQTVNYQRQVDYSVANTTVPATAKLGQAISYVFTFNAAATSNKNIGGSVSFVMPSDFTITGATTPAAGWSCSTASAPTVTCSKATVINASDTAAFTVSGSYPDDPTNNLGATGSATRSVTTFSVSATNAQNTNGAPVPTTADTAVSRQVDFNAAVTTTPANAILGSANAVDYVITATSVAGSNTIPIGGASITFTAPVDFNINSATPGGANAANWACAAADNTTHTVACSNASALGVGAATITVNGYYIDAASTTQGSHTITSQLATTKVVNAATVTVPATSQATMVTRQATLQVAATTAPANAILGSANAVDYVVTVTSATGTTNNIAPAGSVTVTFSVPVDFNINTATPGGTNGALWTCGAANNTTHTVACSNNADFPVGGTLTLDLNGYFIDAASSSQGAHAITSALTVSSAITNLEATLVSTNQSTNVLRQADLEVATVSAPATAGLGATAFPVDYIISVTSLAGTTNNIAPTGSVTVTFTVPADFTIVSATPAGTNGALWACAAADNTAHTVACANAADFPVGGTLTLDVNGYYNDDAVNTTLGAHNVTSVLSVTAAITNVAAAPAKTTTQTTVVDRKVNLSLAGSANITNPYLTQDVTYTYTVTNAGPNTTASPSVDANSVVVNITVPTDFAVTASSLTATSNTSAGWACTQSGQVVTCKLAGTTVLGAAQSATFTFHGNYQDLASFLTATKLETMSEAITVSSQTNLSTAAYPAVAVTAKRAVALTATLAQKDDVTLSATQVAATDAFTYTVALGNTGPDNASAPGTPFVVTVPVNANFVVASAVVTGTDAGTCVIDNTAHTVTCSLANITVSAADVITIKGSFTAPFITIPTGIGSATASVSLADTNTVNTGVNAVAPLPVIVMNTHLGASINPFLPASLLKITYPTVTVSGVTAEAQGTTTLGAYSKAETYTSAEGALAAALPTGSTKTFAFSSTSATALDRNVHITNSLAAGIPAVCYNTTGKAFVKPERVRIYSSTSGLDLTTLTGGTFTLNGQVCAMLSDWTSGANYNSNLAVVEPVNRPPSIIPTLALATSLGAVTQVGNTVTFDLRKLFADADFDQPCFGKAYVAGNGCDDSLQITIGSPSATNVSPATTGNTQTVSNFPGNPHVSLASISGMPTQYTFSIPANSSVVFTLTAKDQVGATTTVTYTVASGGTTAPPDVQTVSAGGSAAFRFDFPTGQAGTMFLGCASATTTTLSSVHIACSPTPSQITSGQFSTVLVTTSVTVASNTPAPNPVNEPGRGEAMMAALYALSGLPVFGILLLRSRNRKLVRGVVIGWLALVVVLMMVGCGGGGFQASPATKIGSGTTPTGTYVVRVSAYTSAANASAGTGAVAFKDYTVVVK